VSALRGFVAGTIAVSTAELLLANSGVAGRIGTAGSVLTNIIDRVVNPDVPAIGPANWTQPPPATFGASSPSVPTNPNNTNQQGGVGSQPYGPPTSAPRSKVLHSTKAKPPKRTATPHLTPTPGSQ
jgi:hypothetical protein